MEVLEQLLQKIDHLEKNMVILLDQRFELKNVVSKLKEENDRINAQRALLEKELTKAKQNTGISGVELKPNGVATLSPAMKTKLDDYIKELEKCIAQLNE